MDDWAESAIIALYLMLVGYLIVFSLVTLVLRVILGLTHRFSNSNTLNLISVIIPTIFFILGLYLQIGLLFSNIYVSILIIAIINFSIFQLYSFFKNKKIKS